MPLDGLRAWIGEVERKLGMRTRVFLVLATIAIGGAGAAIYLALDTREDAVSEADVRALQERLEERIVTGGATSTGTGLSELEADLKALEAEVEETRGGSADGGNSADGGSSAGGSGDGGSDDDAGTGGLPGGTSGAEAEPDDASGTQAGDKRSIKERLPELIEQTKQKNERIEAEEENDESGD